MIEILHFVVRRTIFFCFSHQVKMPPKKPATALPDSDKSVLLSVYQVLKWKGLNTTAKKLASEAGFTENVLQQYTPEAGSAVWNRLQVATKPEVQAKEESESNSEETEVSSEEESEVAYIYVHC